MTADYEIMLDDTVARVSRLKRRGVKAGLIAEKAGIHAVQLSQLLSGARVNVDRLVKIRAVLDDIERAEFFYNAALHS